MSSGTAAAIIDLYQRKASHWIENRAGSRLFEKSWLDRFRALQGSIAETATSTH